AGFVSNFNLRPSMHFDAGFDHYDARFNEPELNRPYILTRNAKGTTDAAMGWLATQDRADKRPFFIWIHYQDPHGPYTPPKRFARPLDDYPQRKLPVLDNNYDPNGIPKYQVIDNQRESAFYRSQYDGEVLFFDLHFGRLVAFLKEKGLYDPSVIVFTADHGESMGEHRYWFCHGQDLYSELTSVPLIMKVPGRAPGRCETRVCHMDLYPTLMGLADPPGRKLDRFRGRDLLDPAFAAEPERPLYSETRREATQDWLRSVIVGSWKLIASDKRLDEETLLFDLSSDPEEMQNRFAAEPRIADQMIQALDREKAKALSGISASEVELNPEEQKNLEALGYTGK
ncbi:MAG: sulfatase, partial [Planctomycetota bacterium]